MLTKINKRIKKQKGFTLVELLLGVAILAVLAFLAVPAIASTIRNSRIRTCASNEIMIEQAVWRWYADQVAKGISQPFFEKVVVDGEWTDALDDEDLAEYFRPSKAPTCPFGGTEGYLVFVDVREDEILYDVLVECGDGHANDAPTDADMMNYGSTGDLHPRAEDRLKASFDYNESVGGTED